jgi:hypothetical protein
LRKSSISSGRRTARLRRTRVRPKRTHLSLASLNTIFRTLLSRCFI